MKTTDELESALDELISEHYYTEDYIFAGIIRSYVEQLNPSETDLYKRVVAQRLARESSIVNVMLCHPVRIPEATPILVTLLNGQAEASQLTRAIISVLKDYRDNDAYRAIERFLDSEQEIETLAALARMDFRRTIPHIRRMLVKNHFLDACLHIFYDRKKEVGLDTLIYELKTYAIQDGQDMGDRLQDVFFCKEGDYNPFSSAELEKILSALERSE